MPLCQTPIRPDNFSPFPKNPVIARIFKEIALADELGSGVRNLFQYTRHYSKRGDPELIEGDIFKIIIPLPSSSGAAANETVNETVKLSVLDKKIIESIQRKNKITYDELSFLLKKARATFHRNIRQLTEKGVIRRVGPPKNGHWEVGAKPK
jgi:ATP-dependent DNA helicase RecG